MGGLEGAKELKSNPRHGGKPSTVSKSRSISKTYLTLQTRRQPDGATCKTLKPKDKTSTLETRDNATFIGNDMWQH